MSGTRSLYQRAPAINPANSTLVLGWYGSRNGADHERMAAHTKALVDLFGFADGFDMPMVLDTDGEQFGRFSGAPNTVVIPVFMCSGITWRHQLSSLLRTHGAQHKNRAAAHVLPIIGDHPKLAELTVTRAVERSNPQTSPATLLLVAHGSMRDRSSRESTQKMRDRISAMGGFSDVRDVYLQATPRLSDVLPSISGDIVLESLFLTEGRHSTHDFRSEISAAKRDSRLSPLIAIGADPRLLGVLTSVVEDGLAGVQS